MAKDYAKAFYTGKRWRLRRAQYLDEVHHVCNRCGGYATMVHHKTRLTAANINDSYLTLDSRNLEALCQDCHNAIDHDHLEDDIEEFDASGNYLPRER